MSESAPLQITIPEAPVLPLGFAVKLTDDLQEHLDRWYNDGLCPTVTFTRDGFKFAFGIDTFDGNVNNESKTHHVVQYDKGQYDGVADLKKRLAVNPKASRLSEKARDLSEQLKSEQAKKTGTRLLEHSSASIRKQGRNGSGSSSAPTSAPGSARESPVPRTNSALTQAGQRAAPHSTNTAVLMKRMQIAAPTPVVPAPIPEKSNPKKRVEPQHEPDPLDDLPSAKRPKRAAGEAAKEAISTSSTPVRKPAGKSIPKGGYPMPTSNDEGDSASEAEDTGLSPRQSLRQSAERSRRLSAQLTLPMPPPLYETPFDPTVLDNYPPKTIENFQEFEHFQAHWAEVHPVYLTIHSQLMKNTEDFATLGKALKAAKGAAKDPLRAQIRQLFTQRRSVVDSMRKNFKLLHDHLNACRENMEGFVSQTLQQ